MTDEQQFNKKKQGDIPAPPTMAFIDKQTKINENFNIFMATTDQKYDFIIKRLDNNDQQHERLFTGIDELKGFFVKILLGIGAIAVTIIVSYLLIKAGLPRI